MEKFVFDGNNYEELKQYFPELELYDFRRKGHEEFGARETLTVGWKTEHGFTEALPGFYLIKEGDDHNILDPDTFKKMYE